MIPDRMSFGDCAKAAAAAHRRARKVPAAPPPKSGAPPRLIRRDMAFKGAEFNRLTLDWNASRVPADEEIRAVMGRLRARARDLARNNPYIRQYLNLLKVNVVGPEGPRHQAQVRDNSGTLSRLSNDRIEAAWQDWSRAPTVDGKLSLVDFQHLTIETAAKEGEAFVRLRRGFAGNRFGFALEAVDPDLVDELNQRPPSRQRPEIRMGVEIDRYGKPLAYHIWDAPLTQGGFAQRREMERVSADDVIHLYRMDRPNLTRGVTWLAPVMWALNMLDGYEDAEITACRVAASAMGFFTRKEATADVSTDVEGHAELETNPGQFVYAPEGYDLASWDPQHPNNNYQAFIKGVLRKIASGLGLSYNALANDLEHVNYSSMRSGTLIERDLWRTLQTWWINAFLQPVYAEWMNMALLNGALSLDSRDRRKFLAVKWTPRGWQWVDPAKDTEAGIKEIQTGLGSRTALLAEQGKDYEETLEQLAEEQELARQYGVDIAGPQPAGAGGGAPVQEMEQEGEMAGAVNGTTNGNGNGHAAVPARRWRWRYGS
jgi:lambda family phage portal protein